MSVASRPVINPVDHLHLLRQVAAQFSCVGMDAEDLQQEGFAGLARACETYGDDHSGRFEAWAVVCIRNAIINAIRTHGGSVIHVPSQQAKALQGDAPSDLTTNQLHRREAAARVLSGRMTTDHSLEDGNLGGIVPDHRREFDLSEFNLDVAPRLAALPMPHREVVTRRFGLNDGRNETIGEIAKAIRRSPTNTTKILTEALAFLRDPGATLQTNETTTVHSTIPIPERLADVDDTPRCEACGKAFKNRAYHVCYNEACHMYKNRDSHASKPRRRAKAVKTKKAVAEPKAQVVRPIPTAARQASAPLADEMRREAAAMVQAAELLGSLPEEMASRVVSWLSCRFTRRPEGVVTHAAR